MAGGKSLARRHRLGTLSVKPHPREVSHAWHAPCMTDKRWEELVEGAVGGSVTPGTMFGSKGLRTGRKFFAIWWHDQLVVKLPPGRIEEIVGAGDAVPFEPMTGRAMNGWVVVEPTEDWAALVAEAHAFVESQQN